MLNFWTFFDPFPSQRLSEFFYWPSFIDDLPFLNSGTMKGCPYSDSLSVFMCYNSNLTCTHNFSFYIIFFALVCNSLTNDDSFSLIIWKIRWLFCRKKKSYMAVFPFISLIKGVLSYSGEGTGMLLDFRIYRINKFKSYFTGSIVPYPKLNRCNGTCWTFTNDSSEEMKSCISDSLQNGG